MTLISFGALYVGLDASSFNDMWCTDTAWTVHLGRLRLELDRPSFLNGPPQKTANRSGCGAIVKSNPTSTNL